MELKIVTQGQELFSHYIILKEWAYVRCVIFIYTQAITDDHEHLTEHL